MKFAVRDTIVFKILENISCNFILINMKIYMIKSFLECINFEKKKIPLKHTKKVLLVICSNFKKITWCIAMDLCEKHHYLRIRIMSLLRMHSKARLHEIGSELCKPEWDTKPLWTSISSSVNECSIYIVNYSFHFVILLYKDHSLKTKETEFLFMQNMLNM